MTSNPPTETLKKNEYKRVERVFSKTGSHVVKTFLGHSPENCERNARHTFAALTLLKEHFSDVLSSPDVYALDGCSVTMGFLDELPRARQLDFTTLPAASAFFKRCYEVETNTALIWSIEDSIHATPKILQLMHSNFPIGLGFKGDLFENLRISRDRLMLADSETASVEPLGLSELILYVYLSAGGMSLRGFNLRKPACVPPVAFSVLDGKQSRAVLDAALEFCQHNMRSVPGLVRAIKLRRADSMLSAMLR